MQQEEYVRALLREREGYVLKGKEQRVADVDRELERNGVVAEEASPSPEPETIAARPLPERATPPKPRR